MVNKPPKMCVSLYDVADNGSDNIGTSPPPSLPKANDNFEWEFKKKNQVEERNFLKKAE